MIGIIGGGMLGLSLAFFLSKKGYQVTVFEKNERLGGNASWIELDGFAVDKFYHAISSRDRYIKELIFQLGLAQRLKSTQTKMGFFNNGRLYSLSGIGDFFKFPYLKLIDRLRLGHTIISAKSLLSWRRIEGITSNDWLIKHGGRRNYKYLWEPIMKAKFGNALNRLAATDIWFRINRMTSLRSFNLKEYACYLDGSLKVFWQAMEEKLAKNGVQIKKNCPVNQILIEGKRLIGVATDSGEVRLNTVICTAPLSALTKLLLDTLNEYKEALGQISYLNNICLILRLKNPLTPFYQLNLADSQIPFTGIIGATNLYPAKQFDETHIFYISKYFNNSPELFQKPSSQIIDEYLPHLKKICPEFSRDWIISYKVVREREVEPLHIVNYSKYIPSFATPIKNLYLLCNAQIYPEPTILDESVRYAKRFVERFYR